MVGPCGRFAESSTPRKTDFLLTHTLKTSKPVKGFQLNAKQRGTNLRKQFASKEYEGLALSRWVKVQMQLHLYI